MAIRKEKKDKLTLRPTKKVGHITMKRPYDLWTDMDQMFNIFFTRIKPYRKRVTILKGDSTQMADKVKDGSLDFIFIDADHRYAAVKKDIIAWTPKLKPGGLLSGHDINLPGVFQAVEELIPNYVSVGIDHVWAAKKEDYVGSSDSI